MKIIQRQCNGIQLSRFNTVDLIIPIFVALFSSFSRYMLQIMSVYEKKYTLSLEIDSKVKKMVLLSFISMGLLVTFDSIDFKLSRVILPLGIQTVYPEFTGEYY